MGVYVKKAVREMQRLVELQKERPLQISPAFNIDYMEHYVLLGKNLSTGRVRPYSLELHRQTTDCVYFAEEKCMDIYRAAVREMRNNPNIRLGIFDTLALSGEPKFWKPRKPTK